MADELLRRGHDVTVFSLMPGRGAKLMPCPVVTDVPDQPFDLILVNHNTCLGMVQHLPVVKIFTSHGPFHPVEQFKLGADAYVAVSEEVWACGIMHGFRPTIIRNPIDRGLFEAKLVIERPGDALILLKNRDACYIAEEACRMAGMSRIRIGHEQIDPIDNMATEMPFYKVVLGGGRGILEALACGCQAFCLNSLNMPTGLKIIADGWVTPETIMDYRMFNCSSRCTQTEVDATSLAEILKDRQAVHHQAWGMNYVAHNNDVGKAVDAYLGLAERTKIRRPEKEAVAA